jgi:hypothetical protein
VSPEFQRNAWLELTPYRLMAMPVVLTGVFLIALLFEGGDPGADLAVWAVVVFAGIVLPWGNRLIADSLTQEIAGNTWDRQRMSAMGAWEMTWGKLFGSTIYVWYGGGLCLAVFVVSLGATWRVHQIAVAIAIMVLTGVFSHAACFMFTLLAVRRQRLYGPIRAGLYQFAGTIISAAVLVGGLAALFDGPGAGFVTWFGQTIPTPVFVLFTVGVWAMWSVAGAVAVMRAEFHQRDFPWLWLGHLIFSMIYIAGIDLIPDVVSRFAPWLPTGLFPAFCLAIGTTYVTVFCEPKRKVWLKRLARFVMSGDIVPAVREVPRFALGVVAVGLSGAAIILVGMLGANDETAEASSRLGLFTLSIFLFVVRDIAIVLVFSAISPKFAERRAFIFLLIVYTALPSLLSMLSLDPLLALFWPIWSGGFLVSVLPGVVQATVAITALLVIHRNFSLARGAD